MTEMQHKKVSKILSGLLDTFEKYGTTKNKLPSDAALPSTKGATAITGHLIQHHTIHHQYSLSFFQHLKRKVTYHMSVQLV